MNSNVISPRNIWAILSKVIELAESGEHLEALKLLDGHRFHPRITDELYATFRRRLNDIKCLCRTQVFPKVNVPADFLENEENVWLLPFRILKTNEYFPQPYPLNLALPEYLGALNDTSFLYQAAPAIALGQFNGSLRVDVHYQVDNLKNLERFLACLCRQDGHHKLRIFIYSDEARLSSILGLTKAIKYTSEVFAFDITSAQGLQCQIESSSGSDLIILLSGDVVFDDGFISRACHLGAVTDNVIQPIQHIGSGTSLTAYASKSAQCFGQFPYRDIQNSNLAVSSALLKKVGPLGDQFETLLVAARELAFRCFNAGAYFAPLLVMADDAVVQPTATAGDQQKFAEICPNPWDRKSDGRYKVPKVSIYIPAYNASKYIERAIESVLSQDMQDLEVCIADDGSSDDTIDVLNRAFGSDERVRWETGVNGGIGHASNRAISMSRGIYIGQLDSDDCLKPGAVRRMAEFLDEHPRVSCCYGSCERVDKHGNFLQLEYSWEHFSRRKMMLTSIAHHFRMFRRSAWERTSRFRTDITNAVDYDIFLKLCETGEFHHINEVLYQRRWHGENTSNVNEDFQTVNTYRVQREALRRQGLQRYWDVHVGDPMQPRRVGYKRIIDTPQVIFWPNYSRANPYQKLLYKEAMLSHEVIAGSIEDAIKVQEGSPAGSEVIFHLHWTNFLFVEASDRLTIRLRIHTFLKNIIRFKELGGRVVWTVHNTLSHDNPHVELEKALSLRIVELADVIHFHSAASVPEVQRVFSIPSEKIRVSRHGSYLGVYADHITPATARSALGIDKNSDVILFVGQVRPYKGVGRLVQSFRELLTRNPNLQLIIAGAVHEDFWKSISPELTLRERERILVVDRFLDDTELQVFFRAADFAAFPYRNILTSGSLLLSLSFGVPVVIPRVGMTAEVLGNKTCGFLFDKDDPSGLRHALGKAIELKHCGKLQEARECARQVAEEQSWPNLAEKLFDFI